LPKIQVFNLPGLVPGFLLALRDSDIMVFNMANETGGLGSGDKQRQTAALVARKKVLESYGAHAQTYTDLAGQPQVDAEEWRKYHSAWQEYYQKYYGDYYHQAARDYVEQAKLKYERAQSEHKVSAADVKVIEEEILAEAQTEGIREQIRSKASDRARKVRRSKHFIPLVIGIAVVVLGVLFQYNQVIFANVAAFVAPGGGAVSGIEAIDPNVTAAVGPESLLIIPKLNIRVPIVFGSANDVNSMNNAMSDGVAHFAVPGASAIPGEIGNFVVSGHSGGNIYRAADFKFIFSGLDRLVEGDLIYVNYNSVRYTYSVTIKQTVLPTNVAALTGSTSKPLVTLVTCVPLGTSRYRLLVTAEQISPDPKGAATMEPAPEGETQEILMPENDPSPLEQFWNWLTGNG